MTSRILNRFNIKTGKLLRSITTDKLSCDIHPRKMIKMVGSVSRLSHDHIIIPDISGISKPLFVNMPDLVIYVINRTGMVLMYHPRCVCLFASITVLLESTFVYYVFTVLWDNGLYDTLIDHRTTLDLRIDEGVEVMTFVGDTSGVFPSLGCPDFHLGCDLW